MTAAPAATPLRAARAFTLIELLVVVAIIAILASIAIPNMLEAQMRAKVARVKADIRTLTLALEAYAVDSNAYPYFNPAAEHSYLSDIPMLTTPVAYLTSLPRDVFPRLGSTGDDRESYYRYYPIAYWRIFYPQLDVRNWNWIIMSNGPDQTHDITRENAIDAIQGRFWMLYDPSNGTVSKGDIWATNEAMRGGGLD